MRAALTTLTFGPWEYDPTIATPTGKKGNKRRHPPGWRRSAKSNAPAQILYREHRHWCNALGLYVHSEGAGRWEWTQSIDTEYERRRHALERIVRSVADEARHSRAMARHGGWTTTEVRTLERLATHAGHWLPGETQQARELLEGKTATAGEHPAWHEVLSPATETTPPPICAKLSALILRPANEIMTFTRPRWEVHVDEDPIARPMPNDDPRRRWGKGEGQPWSWGMDMPQTHALAEAITATVPEACADAAARPRALHLLQTLEPWRGHVIEMRALRAIIAGEQGERPSAHTLGNAKHW